MIPFMLDTSVCISILRGGPHLETLPDLNLIGIPVMVAAELWTGIAKNRETHPHKEQELALFLSAFSIPDFTPETARRYAQIRADLETKGTPIGAMDLLIAAEALCAGATLLTANAREFSRVEGLKVWEWKPK